MPARYLLDTNICIYIAKYRPPAVRERFARHSASELAMSVINLGALCFRAEKSQVRNRAIAAIEELTGLIPVYDLPELAGEHYGQIRADLKTGQTMSNNNLWLAAHARSQDWILVTKNEGEFLGVPGLRVENWVN
ncbi:type II toxin-antitoxin system VapC family toxin [Methylomonas sp. CM2]|uniref:type II toxin-antitoxin system VapC family toxin n=1 Tax=Methylomonas sp. CM2 TaxID=3417647 RepID=UPI003CF2B031